MVPRREPAYLQVARADDDAGEWEDDREEAGSSIVEAINTQAGSQAWTEAPMELGAQKVRHRVSAAYFLAFFGLGMIIASPGPCLLAMVQQTRSENVAQVSVIFVARAAGYLTGSVLGGISLDALPTRGNLVLALALLAAASCTVLVPLVSSLSVLSSLMVAIGLAMGVTDTAANVLMIALHGKGDVDPYMHAQHFFFGLGAFSSPLALLWAMGDTYHYSGAMWAFGAILATGGAVLLALPSPNTGGAAEGAAHASSEVETGGGGAVRCVGLALTRQEWFVVGATAMFLAQYVGIEVAFGGFIYTYSVQYTGLTQDLSKLVTSCYWGSIAAGRLLSTVLSAYKVSPKAIIEASVTGATLSSLLLCIVPASPAVLWASTCLFGLSLAPIFAWAMNNAEVAMSVSGRVATILIIGASAGEMALPALAGGLFAHVGPLSLPWFILLSSMVQCMFYYCLAGRTAEAMAARDLQVLQSQGDCALFGEEGGGGGDSAAGPCEGTGVPAACTKAGAAKPSADDEDAPGIAML